MTSSLMMSGCSWLKDWDGDGGRQTASRVTPPQGYQGPNRQRPAQTAKHVPYSEELLSGENYTKEEKMLLHEVHTDSEVPARQDIDHSKGMSAYGHDVANASVEERVARLERSVVALQDNYHQTLPMFQQLKSPMNGS